MSQRRSGWVGAVVLMLVAVSAACGGRSNVFVLDDEAPSGAGGMLGQAGSFSTGNNSSGGTIGAAGHAGTFSTGGHGGVVGAAGHAGTFGVGGHAGTVGVGGVGGAIAFGGAAGFGGKPGFDCAACLAQNTVHSFCSIAECNFVTSKCDIVPNNEGQVCFGAGTCAPRTCKAGECVQATTTTCPASTVQCQAASCDVDTGQCVTVPVTGGACDDADPCTISDQCLAGKCAPGPHIASCQNNDKCCPAGCTFAVDNDCAVPTQVVLPTRDRGWYQSSGLHEITNKNTLTGFSSGFKYNSFFSFDLTGITRPIVSAQLALEQETYYGTDATETASIWDVTTSAALVSSSVQSLDIYNDLQSGTQFGSLTVSANLTGTIIMTPLNAKAIAALNAARGGAFTFGVHLDTLSGQMFTDEGVRFSASDEPRKNQLILNLQ